MTKARDLASNAEGTKPKVIDAAGDLIYGTGSDAASRLAIGTAGQVLQVNSGATAPEWGTLTTGSLTQIATGSMSGTTVSITSIPAIYKDLVLILKNYTISSGTDMRIELTVNSTTGIYSNGNLTSSVGNPLDDTNMLIGTPNSISSTGNFSHLTFRDYANTDTYKIVQNLRIQRDTNTAQWDVGTGVGGIELTGAISSIQIVEQAGGSFNAGTYTLYGVL